KAGARLRAVRLPGSPAVARDRFAVKAAHPASKVVSRKEQKVVLSKYHILDSAFLAHVGFTTNGQPFVIPTLYGRDGDKLYLHGSAASRMLRELETGIPACVNVTIVDGLVLARSAFHHSMNYRSVVAFGTARKIVDPAQKIFALRAIAEP